MLDGRKRRIHFAAYRLKYSRWVWGRLVPDERVESLVRALLLAFEQAGGVPLRVVFDRPKTVVVGQHEDARPIWNATLAQVAIDYGFTIELCAPRSPEQKGSVESLVGFVKRRFFRARRFLDVHDDLPRQLLEWLVEVNDERPSRATKEIPRARLQAELEHLKPLAVRPAEYALRYPVHLGPTALVEFGASGTRCRPVRAAFPPRCTSTSIASGSRRAVAASRPRIRVLRSPDVRATCRANAPSSSRPWPEPASGSTSCASGSSSSDPSARAI